MSRQRYVTVIRPEFLIQFTAAYIATGIVLTTVSAFTGWDTPLIWFHAKLGAAALVFFSLAEYIFCTRIRSRFEPDEPMKGAWFLLMGAAWCRMVGYAFAHAISHLDYLPGSATVHRLGLYLSGPVAMLFMAGGLGIALGIYHRLRMVKPITRSGWVMIVLVGVSAMLALAELSYWGVSSPTPAEAVPFLNWITDPLLLVLAVEAALLASSAEPLADGLLGRCWKSYSLGIAFTAVGNIGLWMDRYQFLRWPYEAYPMLAWYSAAAAFSIGAAYQWTALRAAEGSTVRAALLPSSHNPD